MATITYTVTTAQLNEIKAALQFHQSLRQSQGETHPDRR
jgi:hypothetical protein